MQTFYFRASRVECDGKKAVYINYMRYRFHKSQNQMFCAEQKISKVAFCMRPLTVMNIANNEKV